MLYILYSIVYLLTGCMEQCPSWETNWFSASQEIPAFYGNHSFITAFTSAYHLSLSWAHTSGSIQVWGTRLHFVTWFDFTVRSFLHLTQTLTWSTIPCRLSATAYSIYLQLPYILEAVPPSATWGHAMLWWHVPNYLGYIACYDGFIVTNPSEHVLSICIINTTAYFLLDMFHSYDHQERSHFTPRTCHCKSYVLRLL